ncbi:MAG: cysteine desulfurase family protein [Spirochaetia bacterium]
MGPTKPRHGKTLPIYLDYNATTPHAPEVIEAIKPYLEEHFGNPSSSHVYGTRARAAVLQAREQVAAFLGCHPDEVIFTSGGTESNNYAIRGLAHSRREAGNHIITSQVEHPAVIEVCRFLETQGFAVTCLPVDSAGMVDPVDVEEAITSKTILITIMHANNEVGTIEPIEDIAAIARRHGIAVHTDAAQSAGKIPVEVVSLGVDLLSLAGHKLYAPKGIGALFVKKGLGFEKLLLGAGQERGRRAGTENVMHIVGLGKACEIAKRDLVENRRRMYESRERLYKGLHERAPTIRLNGHLDRRLPNTLSIGFPGVDADRMLDRIGDRIAASAGAACHSDSISISAVLQAMHVPLEWARGTLRFSTGRNTTESEITEAVDVLASAYKGLA